jgi:hypothetical protein
MRAKIFKHCAAIISWGAQKKAARLGNPKNLESATTLQSVQAEFQRTARLLKHHKQEYAPAV